MVSFCQVFISDFLQAFSSALVLNQDLEHAFWLIRIGKQKPDMPYFQARTFAAILWWRGWKYHVLNPLRQEMRKMCVGTQWAWQTTLTFPYIYCIYTDVFYSRIFQNGFDEDRPELVASSCGLYKLNNLCCGCTAFWSDEATVDGGIGVFASYLKVWPA